MTFDQGYVVLGLLVLLGINCLFAVIASFLIVIEVCVLLYISQQAVSDSAIGQNPSAPNSFGTSVNL